MKLWLAPLSALLLSGCLTYPPPSSAPYRAVGQEPGWTLVIDERDLTFIPAGGQPVRQPRPQAIIGIAGEIYQTPRIGVNIVHSQCTDVMSGQSFRDRVQIDVDGRRFNGCGGGAVAPASLAGTNWRVAAVNGRATPAQGDYSIRFEADRMGAKFGCNSMGGLYEQTANVVHVRDVSQTLIGCPEPSATFERQGSAILSRPMTMSWNGGDRLTLGNASGQIDLTRSY